MRDTAPKTGYLWCVYVQLGDIGLISHVDNVNTTVPLLPSSYRWKICTDEPHN